MFTVELGSSKVSVILLCSFLGTEWTGRSSSGTLLNTHNPPQEDVLRISALMVNGLIFADFWS